MASTPIVSAVFGATGLVGSHLVSALLSLDAFGTVHTITRRAPKQSADAAVAAKLDAVVETDTQQWTTRLADVAKTADGAAPALPVVFSALGTTRLAAGGIANQWKIDHDLNVDIVRAAQTAGVRTFVFVSSAGTHGLLARMLPYSRMKNGVEAAVQTAVDSGGFDQAIVLHPGLIQGHRDVEHQGAGLARALVGAAGRISHAWADALAQDADVIAKAAAHAALLAARGQAPAKYWVLEPADILRLGRDEWNF